MSAHRSGTLTNCTFPTLNQNTTGSAGAVATTPASGDNSVNIATTAFVQSAVGTLGTMASQNASSVAITGGAISNVTLSSNFILLKKSTIVLRSIL